MKKGLSIIFLVFLLLFSNWVVFAEDPDSRPDIDSINFPPLGDDISGSGSQNGS